MRIPNLAARNLFAEGALSSAFVPVFSQYLANRGRREAAVLSTAVSSALAVTVGALCVVGLVFSPQLVDLLAPGFAAVPGKQELAVLLTRILFPFLALVALAAQAMGVQNACNRFGIPALASTFFRIGSVAVGLALGFTVGRGTPRGLIISMACGVLAGGLWQLLWQFPSLRREGFLGRPRWDLQHPGLRQIARLMLPALLGNRRAADRRGGQHQPGVRPHRTYGRSAQRTGQLVGLRIPLPATALGIVRRGHRLGHLPPEVSRSAAAGRMDEFRSAIARALGLMLLVTIPSSAGLAVLGESMIGAIYQGGRFQAYDTHQTAVALALYSVGLAGYSATKILSPAFYALDDGRTPMLVSVASVGLNLALAVSLVKGAGIGHAGLALFDSARGAGGRGRPLRLAAHADSRHWRAGAGGERVQDRCGDRGHGAGLPLFERLGARGAGRRTRRATRRCGCLDPPGRGGFLLRGAAFGDTGTGGGESRVLHCLKECFQT